MVSHPALTPLWAAAHAVALINKSRFACETPPIIVREPKKSVGGHAVRLDENQDKHLRQLFAAALSFLGGDYGFLDVQMQVYDCWEAGCTVDAVETTLRAASHGDLYPFGADFELIKLARAPHSGQLQGAC